MLENFVGQVSEIATLLIFITLGMNLPFEALGQYLLGGLLVMAIFIFVARPVTVLACLLPDKRGRWTREELAFLSWSRYTGVIPAAVASLLLARGVEGAEIAVSLVALAVCDPAVAGHHRRLRGPEARPHRGTGRSVARANDLLRTP